MNTIKKLFLAIILIPGCVIAQEQTKELPDEQLTKDSKARDKIEAARIGLISSKLGLSPDQAEKFWPIYREFSQKRVEMRNELRTEQNRLKPEARTPEQQKQLVDLGLTVKQRELDLEKVYSGRLLNVITADQLLNLRTAERDFQRMVIQQLQQRRETQQRRELIRERNQQLRKRP